MTITQIGRRAWSDLGGDLDLLRIVEGADPPVALVARLDVANLLFDSVALATLAVQKIQAVRGQRADVAPVRVDGDRVTTASQSERHLRINGVAPEVWSPLSGFWRTADGWVRTHGNYPHHAERLARLLGVRHDAPKDTIAAAIAKRSAVALEEAAAEVGAIVGAVRRSEEWERHPQAAAVGAMPLIAVAHAPGAPAAPWTPGGTTPLAGVRVLDLTRVLAGPVATRNLAFAGAAVLRVDSPRLPEADWIHLDTGAGKRSTLLDLAAPDDRRTFEELLDQAHVVVTGYRPESLDPFGLSADALTERRPGIVVASVSAWGAEGPWGTRRGFDSIVQAVTGIAWLESTDGEAPGALPAQVLDHSAGHLLTAAILESLHRQRRDGGTWEVRVALAPIARALIALPRSATTGASGHTPALQTGRTGAGEITCAAPPMTYAGGPARYPSVARSWGADAAVWP